MSILGRTKIKSDDVTLSAEMIAFQNNDYFVSECNEIFEKLILLVNNTNLNGVKFYKEKNVKALLGKLDSLIHDRFGLRTKQVYTADTLFATLPVVPKSFNIINNLHKHLSSAEKEADKVKRNKKTDDIINVYQDYDVIVKQWIDGVRSLDKKLYEEGIYVDLEKARIDNLPKDFVVFVFSNIPMLVKDFNVASDEFTAILLHEIGHAFTHIEYSIYTVRTTSTMIDSIRENLNKKNKTYKETLNIVYEDILNGGKDELKNHNAVTVTIKVLDKFMKDSLSITENTRVSTNSEQLADVFATRFGVGESLVSSLAKFETTRLNNNAETLVISMGTEFMIMLGIFFIIEGSITLALTGIMWFLIIGFIMTVITNMITSLATKGKTKEVKTYEDTKRRYQEVRNEMVKQLRMSIPKEQLPSVLEAINRTDAFISLALRDTHTLSTLDKVIRFVSFDAKKNIEVTKVDELVEDLMSNDLYIAAARTSLIKGK